MTEFKPSKQDLREAKKIAEEGISEAEEFLDKEEDVRVGFGWTEEPFVKENMNGATGLAKNPAYFKIKFNTEVEGWRKSVLGTSVHEFAHTYFYEKTGEEYGENKPIWRYIIDEALTQNLTEKLVPEAPEPWREKHSIDDVGKYWSKIKDEELDRNYDFPDPLYIDKSEEGYPNWLGYSLSYQIGQKLLETYELADFPELSKEDVVNAGDKLYN